jgi:hypothetical protein
VYDDWNVQHVEFGSILLLVFETGFHYLGQVGLKLMILLILSFPSGGITGVQ